jgi:serine/threonine-protein kinase
MTLQKNKKKLVRARMEKTGESYQTAHAVVSNAVDRAAESESGSSLDATAVGGLVAGRYQILRQVPASKTPLAYGAGSEPPWAVFDAKHVLLGGEVTIKLLPRGGDAALRPWLLREGRALERGAHRQVTKVFDVGETGPGEIFLVLARAPSTTLGAYLEARAMSERSTLDVVLQLAELLAHFEERGVACALSNGAIRVEERGEKLEVTIASLPFADLAGDLGLPPPGGAFRHPAWTSPEEARGATPDARSALYSLGVVLYTMLARRLPERGTRPLRLPASGESPSALAEVCLRLLADDPAARYSGADALLAALRSAVISS